VRRISHLADAEGRWLFYDKLSASFHQQFVVKGQIHARNLREILYDKDCPRIDLFLSQDIFDGPFPSCFFDGQEFFSRIISDL